MTENLNPEDPFGWDEPEPKPETITRWQKIKYTIFAYTLSILFRGLPEYIEQKKRRKEKYREVIKQGWFGEYSEWHER